MDSKAHRFFSTLTRLQPIRLLCFGAALALAAILSKLVSHAIMPGSVHGAPALIRNLVLIAFMLAAYVATVRVLEHRPVGELQPRRAALGFVGGCVAGIGLIAISYLGFFAIGVAHFAPGAQPRDLLMAIGVPAVTAILEELVFRLVLFRVLEQIAGTAVAASGSALVFGAAHLGNPGVTIFDVLALALGMGVLLALSFTASRNIGLPAGIHAGWNFALAYLFGANVSGLAPANSLLQTSLTGPAWLTGGAFGPEGSPVTLAVAVLASAAIGTWALRRGHWMKFTIRFRSPEGETSAVSPINAEP